MDDRTLTCVCGLFVMVSTRGDLRSEGHFIMLALRVLLLVLVILRPLLGIRRQQTVTVKKITQDERIIVPV